MPIRVLRATTHDVRFPTSRSLDGSDAMNADPDYSAAYVVLETDHPGTAALVNAVWDLYARAEGKPLWKLLTDMTPEQLVACIDFRYIDDAIQPSEAVESSAAAIRPRRRRVQRPDEAGVGD